MLIGVPWTQHVAFLDSRAEKNRIRQAIRDGVKVNAGHPAVIAHLVGNEISPDIVRWHGAEKVRNFLEEFSRAASMPDVLSNWDRLLVRRRPGVQDED